MLDCRGDGGNKQRGHGLGGHASSRSSRTAERRVCGGRGTSVSNGPILMSCIGRKICTYA
jgi:hypothetical protein